MELTELYKLQVSRDLIDRFNGGLSERLTWEAVREAIDTLTSGFRFFGYGFPPNTILFRGRKVTGGGFYNKLSEMGPPPENLITSYGRCQRPGQSVIYASTNIETVLAELRSDVGDYVQIGTYKVSEGMPFYTIIGEFDYVRRHGFGVFGQPAEDVKKLVQSISEIERLRIHLTDAFMAEQFRKPARFQRDYKITTAIADVVYAENLEAFAYPSVAHLGGINFAVLAKHFDKFQPVEFSVLKVTDTLGYGIYENRNIAVSTGFKDETIQWDHHDGKLVSYGDFLSFAKFIMSSGPKQLLLCQFLKRKSDEAEGVLLGIAGEISVRLHDNISLRDFSQYAEQQGIEFDYYVITYGAWDPSNNEASINEVRKNLESDLQKVAMYDKEGRNLPPGLQRID